MVTAGRPGPAAHAARAGTPSVRWWAGAVLAAVGATAGIGALGSAGNVPSSPPSARLITAVPQVPLSPAELLALTNRPPEFGALDDPVRRSACLSRLGFPAGSRALGARPVRLAGRAAVVLVLPGDRAGDIVGVAVGEDCGGPRSRLIADTTVRRP